MIQFYSNVPHEKRLQQHLFWFVLCVSLLVSGARLASSDENAIYLLTESIVTRGAFDIEPYIIDNGSMFGSKFYIWAEIGEALFAIPFYLTGKVLSYVIPFENNFKTLFVKAIVSTMNAFFGAFLAVVFYGFCRKLNFTVRITMFLTLTLCFGTFLFPYFKTISRDLQLAFFLCASFYCIYSYKLEKENTARMKQQWIIFAGIFAGFGFLTKMIFLLNVSFLALYLLLISHSEKETMLWLKNIIWFSIPISFAFIVFFLYNYLRFENIFETGYHGGTTFSTPLYYGLYGLLLSAGKGMFIFAPITILLLWSIPKFFKRCKTEAVIILLIIVCNLLLYSKYIAWAGDGSWGPRYLVGILPLALLPLGTFLDSSSKLMKRFAYALAVVGIIIQLGGVSIYFGNYLRSIGEYPYNKGFDNPVFLEKSHFNPYYSPIVGHWRMLKRNFIEHWNGKIPQLTPTSEMSEQRIPLTQIEQKKLLHTLDYWFTYGMYVGFSPYFLLTIFIIVLLFVIVQFFLLLRMLHYTHVDSLLQMNGATH